MNSGFENAAFVFVSFLVISIFTLRNSIRRKYLFLRSTEDWILDISGLLVQGLVIPLFQIGLAGVILKYFFKNPYAFELNPLFSFCLSFFVIDYLYYWNHRLLHSRLFWPLHSVHHSAQNMDLLMTSRNTLYTPIFIVYIWANSMAVFFLKDATWFILGSTLTSAMDIWRHSGFYVMPKTKLSNFLSSIFVTPNLHAWHHSRDEFGINFGANLILWDFIHGTLGHCSGKPTAIGIAGPKNLWVQLLFPFQLIKSKTESSKV